MKGLCTGHEDPDLWFSDTVDTLGSGRPAVAIEREMTSRALAALAICAQCPITSECLAEGMKPENIDNGIWGGKLSGERIQLAYTNVRASGRINRIMFARRVRSHQ